ncbi:hypothetical protein [Aliiroseovarius subalbicans]|uniref:hypothetical protein n=1 Tax=Aliiroseovarius subalbicans TaxID=2925840 RepID=UPI001F599D0F|nr:hypothetical protein [Aliiroseovarius subalbicans]MCI2398202.1 hypothetical protein [Aliiroseovarius subalbicans]
MSTQRFVFLIMLVILCAALTVWVGAMAASSGNLNGQTAMALLPLVMLASIALRALTNRGGDE